MKYALNRKDGGVTILACLPVSATDAKGNIFGVGTIALADDSTYTIKLHGNGGVLVGISTDWNLDGWTFGFNTPEQEIAKWPEDRRSQIVKAVPISNADIPTDRTFRNAWHRNGDGALSVDLKKAREIHRDRMRHARKARLADLDIEYQRADEIGDDKAKREIAARKKVLRDVTALPQIEAAKTPDDLKAVWPEELV